jgi:hypothetical protein
MTEPVSNQYKYKNNFFKKQVFIIVLFLYFCDVKVLFLDNDGVICLSNNWSSRYKKQKKEGFLLSNYPDMPVHLRFDNFDQKAIKVLNNILLETGAEIVISSDWKRWATVEELGDYYLSQGIIKRPISATKFFKDLSIKTDDINYSRGESLELERHFEILDWLKDNPAVTHWVSVDDLNMSNVHRDWGLSNFVLTPISNQGLKQSGVKEKVLKFLL